MKFISFAVCFVNLAAFCHGTLPRFPESLMDLPDFKGQYSGKIVGGEDASPCAHTHQVSIQRKTSTGQNAHFCGGSIVDQNHIVTAGHCAPRSISGITIVAGTQKLNNGGREGVRINVKKVTKHENYSSSTIDNDIAILTLEKSLDFESLKCASPIGLPPQDEDKKYSVGMICHATGWGTTSEGGSTTTTLQVVDVPLVSRSECERNYGPDEITSAMICAGLKEGGKDSCQGDSGGPLVAKLDSNSPHVLVGVTSWGYGCARPGYPGVYTNVARFVNWIYAIIASSRN